MTLFDHFQMRVDEHPENLAFIHGDTLVTYRQLALEAERVARGLQARGVGVGDRVLVLAGNVPEVMATYLAVSRLGAIYVPVSTGFREREARFVLKNAEPKVAIVAGSHAATFLVWDRERTIDVIVLDGPNQPGTSTYSDLGVDAAPVVEVEVKEEDGLLLCYTSGTTSNPKPVLHSQGSEIYNATTYAKVWNLGPGDRGIVCLPLAWVYGLSTTAAAMLVSGATVVLLDRFHPLEVVNAIQAYRATAMWGTMSMYTKLLEVIKLQGDVNLSTLRVVSNGGEPCPPPMVKDFEDTTGLQLLGSYATSEARPIMVVRPGDVSSPPGTTGQLVPGAEIRLVDENGVDVSVGETGHALLRCPGMMTEYYREPQLTAERLTENGWLRSGDLMRADANGYYWVVGRQTEMIIRSGANIAPAEVEAALAAHPDVADVAVVGVPDARSGEAVRAVIVPAQQTPSEDDLRSFLSDQLAHYKVPQQFIFVDELPRTDRGKLDRAALKVAATGSSHG